jgi:carboxyl-terminal processing protease
MSKRNKVLYIFIVLLAFVGGTILGQQSVTPETTFETDLDVSKIIEVYELVNQYHIYDEFDSEQMTLDAIRGMIGNIDRGLTRYLTKSEYESNTRSSIEGTYAGIGVVVIVDDGEVTVVSPYRGTPAEAAGLRSGDIITHVNGESVRNSDIDVVGDLVRGAPGTEVILTIKPVDGGAIFDATIIREIIEIPFVEWEMVGPNNDIAHIGLFSFSRIAVDQLDRALQEAVENGAKEILLDLRGNPGGDLEACLGVADLFLDEGSTVFITQDVYGREEVYLTENEAKYTQPLYVLVDKGSASASEVISGTVMDNERGITIGYNTFGKATMQVGYRVIDGGLLWITTHTYVTPNRNNIDLVGIEPDYVLESELLEGEDSSKEVLNAAIDIIENVR